MNGLKWVRWKAGVGEDKQTGMVSARRLLVPLLLLLVTPIHAPCTDSTHQNKLRSHPWRGAQEPGTL